MHAGLAELLRAFDVEELAHSLFAWLPGVVSALAILLVFYGLWRLAWGGARVLTRRTEASEDLVPIHAGHTGNNDSTRGDAAVG